MTEPSTDNPMMMACEVCQIDVPAGEYCGLCGAPLAAHRGNGPHWLRVRSFSAAPGQHLLIPSVTSSLFPHLPPRSRTAFLVGLTLLLVALTGAALFRLPAALITVAALGLPLLFGMYLRESDVHRDIPRATLVLTAALGTALGIGWVLLTGAAMARASGVPLGMGITATRVMRDGLGVPLGSMLLMLVPALVVRLTRRGTQEALDGYAIGALGALTYCAAATMTRLAPQFTTGMVVRDRPMSGLLVEAGIRGVAVPTTAAAVGGLIGAALWFTRPPNKVHLHRGFVRLTLTLFAVGVMTLYAGLGLIDIARFPQSLQLGLHIVLAAVALLALRVGLHLALLHEAHDEIRTEEPLLCAQCGHVVPDAPFCAHCGAATHASSRTSREARRMGRPARQDESPDITVALLPGYSIHGGTYTAAPVRRTSYSGLALALAVTIAVVAAGLVGLSAVLQKPTERYACPPNCGSPPIGQPVTINPQYTAADGSFTVSYPAPGSAYKITTSDRGVMANLLAGDGGTMQLFSRPAAGRSPKDIAVELIHQTFPDTKTAYEIPNAMVGYQPGYGLAADSWPQSSTSSYARMRVIVMVAVKHDLALVAAAVGPYRQFGPDSGSGKPSGANLQLALDMGKYVNSFRWNGDPSR
ncbi:hypothetical protein M2272_003604 [Mycobacterium frederiksbergense]|uniref:Zinc ribbon domain-containing protein n=1 Tax=Mycolicibacterium frederiksbergense TaxID=117567 RepID=A0ABT6L2W7_9MYCO|nr:zinc ribbon domain-containing protein [Mycolicibacterium frederiksbergense]MDH6196951.1 hypothetical protein [Mycolicibacterium frederiksbergense]